MKAVSEEKAPLMIMLKHFLWWCAGADLTTLKLCPTDHAKFTAIGMMMMAVPCVAAVSFTVFLQQSFNLSSFAAALGGIAWGTLIFILDRLILTFHRKGRREKLRALPRLLLSVCLALVIGEPLLLHFFRSEIELQMRRTGQMVATEARAQAEARFKPEREALQNVNSDLQRKLDELKHARDEKETAIIGEIEGTVGTGVKGEGLAARQKQQVLSEAKDEYERARMELLPKIEANKKRLDQLQAEVEAEVKAIVDAQSAARGTLARHAALFAIMKGEPSTALTYIPLFIILLLTEITPLIIKLTSEPGEYDKRLQLNEANGVARAESEMMLERESRERFAQAQRGVAERIAQAVRDERLAALSVQERGVAEFLHTITLERFCQEMLEQVPSRNRSQKFGREILIEVVDRPDLHISLQLPGETRATTTLDELAGDVQSIGAEVAADALREVELLKATTSSGREVLSAMPLLPQLEADQKLCLQFGSANAMTGELPIA